MKNKNGVEIISDKISELELLAKTYLDSMNEKAGQIIDLEQQISNYRASRNAIIEKIDLYKILLSDFEASNPVIKPVTTRVSRPAKSILGKVSDLTNIIGDNAITNIKNTLNGNTEKVYAIICKDSDEFIKFCDNLQSSNLKFTPSVKNTIATQSNGKLTLVKVSSILDVNGMTFDYILILPNADYNPDYTKMFDAVKMHFKSKLFNGY